MKNSALIFALFPCFVSLAQLKQGQVDPKQVSLPRQHDLPEYTFDTPSYPSRWGKQKEGLHVAFGSTDELYLRSEVPLSFETQWWEETGWRGERLNAQVLVWSPDTIQQIRFKVNDLLNAKGLVIGKNNIQLNMVRYVLSNYPYAAKNSQCDVSAKDTAYLVPDRFENFERFDLPGKTVRPVWVSVEIPVGTEPGTYSGTIEVNSEKHHAALNLRINVQHHVLPKPRDWKFRLDLWQNPWVIA